MKKRLLYILFVVLVTSLLINGCKENSTGPVSDEPSTNKEAMLKLADDDSALASFEPSYNEGDIMSFGKIQAEIFPMRVGHKMRLVNRNMEINYSAGGDTAYAKLTKTFEGMLLIAAAYDSSATQPDTLIKKPFTSVVTRNIIFIKVARTDRPMRNWKIAAVSLPEGGTLSPNMDITKLSIFLPDGDTLVITSPNDYYLSRGPASWWRDFPAINRNDSILIRVELTSAYEAEDFVTLTWGAHRDGLHRAKRKFNLVSSTQNGNVFDKVYEQSLRANAHAGFFHAIINAFPKQVIFDDSAPVENEMWGIPYIVRN